MDHRHKEGFYITLSSNASLNEFRNNAALNTQRIDLEGSWQVALTEISYPHTWFNVPIEDGYFEWRMKPQQGEPKPVVKCQQIRGGYYSNLTQFTNEMNAFLRKISADVQLVISAIQKRFEYQAGGQYHQSSSIPVDHVEFIYRLVFYFLTFFSYLGAAARDV